MRTATYRITMGALFTLGLMVASSAVAKPPPSVKIKHATHATNVTYHGKKTAPKGKDKSGTKTPPKTGDDKPLPTSPYDTSHNKLYRSYITQGDITHVDTFTGNMTIHLPLIHIPGNDDLPLDFTLTFDNHRQSLGPSEHLNGEPGGIFSAVGYGWRDFVGLYTSFPAFSDPDDDNLKINKQFTFYNPVFVDPTGKQHQLYAVSNRCQNNFQCGPVDFVSKDNWHAELYKTSTVWQAGIVISPDGTQYNVNDQVNMGEARQYVQTITSPNKGTILTYHYDDQHNVSSITRNDGFAVTFTNRRSNPDGWQGDELASIQTSDGRRWQLTYHTTPNWTAHNWSSYPATLSTITLPNKTEWQFTAASDGKETRAVDQFGAPNIMLTHIQAPNGLQTTLTYATGYHPVYARIVFEKYDRLAAPYVTSKTLSGAGLPSATWTYTFSKMHRDQYNLYHFNNQTTLTGPAKKVVYTFDVTTNDIDYPAIPVMTPMTGTLLSKAEYDTKGMPLQTTTYTWGKRIISPYTPMLYSPLPCYYSPTGGYVYFCSARPSMTVSTHPLIPNTFVPELQSKTITRGSAKYVTTYSGYDKYGYPASISETSPQGNKSDTLTYYENPTTNIFKPASDKDHRTRWQH